MENPSSLQTMLPDSAAHRLLAAARWAKIYGLLLCIFSGFGLLMMLFSLTAIASFSSFFGGREMGLIYFIFFVYMLVLALMLYLNIQLVFLVATSKRPFYRMTTVILKPALIVWPDILR